MFGNDAFTDADTTALGSHTASDGGSWTKHPTPAGTMQISDANRCWQGTGATAIYYHSATPPSADYFVQVDVVWKSTTDVGPGVVARLDTSVNTHYRAYWSQPTAVWKLDKVVSGTSTNLGTYSDTFTSGTKALRLTVTGTTIAVKIDGTSRISVTDSAISSANKAGIRSAGTASNTTGYHIDNYVAGPGSYTMTSNLGVFTVTGRAANLVAGRKVTASKGTFTLTGIAATLKCARKLVASKGTFTLTGQAATLRADRRLTASPGTFTLTGRSANLVRQAVLAATKGTFALTGHAARLLAGRRLTAGTGTFTLTGRSASLLKGRTMTALAGAFTLTGRSARLLAARLIRLGQGTFVLTGLAADLTHGGAVTGRAGGSGGDRAGPARSRGGDRFSLVNAGGGGDRGGPGRSSGGNR